jgi:putative endonuclease
LSDRRRSLGQSGERLAALHLEAKGYQIVGRNVRISNTGEIDILALDDDTLVFVEVRTRRGLGLAGESIHPRKAARMLSHAENYEDLDHESRRIDLVVVDLDETGRLLGVDHIINAVTAD